VSRVSSSAFSCCSDHDHPHYFNKWVRVSSAANVSNPTGDKDFGKGVFAIRDIPSGTRICPYVGVHRNKPCPASVLIVNMTSACTYKDVYLCGREQLYDQGYLMEGENIHSCDFECSLPS
jgi:hypothetical protein